MIDTSARLVAVSYVGELGAAKRVETKTDILCAIDSVNRAEYFAAYNSGFRPVWRVETDPINYSGQSIIELDTPEGVSRCDVYRTFRKTPDVLELWCCLKNEAAEQPFTLWTAGKRVVLRGAYLSGSDGAERTNTGQVATDTVRLILPLTFQAFVGASPVAYCRPKEYARMSSAEQDLHFYIDVGCFFALGEIDPEQATKYQEINAAYDDVWRVQSVERKNRGAPDTEYLEVVGK